MKKFLLISVLMLMDFTVCAENGVALAPHDTNSSFQSSNLLNEGQLSQGIRSPLFENSDLPLRRSLLDKCLLAGKSLGAGAMSTILGCCCYLNATGNHTNVDGKETGVFDKIQALCVAGAAFVGAAKLGGYSVRNIKAALAG